MYTYKRGLGWVPPKTIRHEWQDNFPGKQFDEVESIKKIRSFHGQFPSKWALRLVRVE